MTLASESRLPYGNGNGNPGSGNQCVMMENDNVQCILMIVSQIPEGRVATYGQIARLAGIPRNSRQVGSVLKTAPPGNDIPWYRVVNSRGEISLRENLSSVVSQREVLESEGIRFDKRGRIPLDEFLWEA